MDGKETHLDAISAKADWGLKLDGRCSHTSYVAGVGAFSG